MGHQKFKLFNPLSWTHETFKVSKYKKIKFDKIWGHQNGGLPLNDATKILPF